MDDPEAKRLDAMIRAASEAGPRPRARPPRNRATLAILLGLGALLLALPLILALSGHDPTETLLMFALGDPGALILGGQ